MVIKTMMVIRVLTMMVVIYDDDDNEYNDRQQWADENL